MLSGHNDADELLDHLLTYKVFVHLVQLLSLSNDAHVAWSRDCVTIGHVKCSS
jgi:hypothetical protein